jgi:tetratricopeptide (TPR) repeat protein
MSEDSDRLVEIQAYQNELDENPYSIKALSELAQHNANSGEYTLASQYYERIVNIDENNGRAWTALGHCYLLKGEYQKCFTAYQKALYTMEDNRDAQLWYGIGLLYNKFESYKYAEPAFQAVLKIDPNFEQKSEVLFKLGIIYKHSNSLENAITYLRNSIAGENILLSRKVEALSNIGKCHEKQNKLPIAIEIYQEALELDPKNFKTLEYLGWAYFNKGDFEQALQHLNNALEHVNDCCAETGDLYYLIGRVYLKMGNYPDGQASFQKAIYKNPNAYLYWCSIGLLYAQALQPQDAFECFVKASNISTDKAEVWMNMGILYETCKQKHEATLAYQRAFTLDPTLEVATRRRQQLAQNEDTMEDLPEFIHPQFEISEVPFSIKKADKNVKSLRNLPDLSKIRRNDDEDSGSAPESNQPSLSTSSLPRVSSHITPLSQVRLPPNISGVQTTLPPTSSTPPTFSFSSLPNPQPSTSTSLHPVSATIPGSSPAISVPIKRSNSPPANHVPTVSNVSQLPGIVQGPSSSFTSPIMMGASSMPGMHVNGHNIPQIPQVSPGLQPPSQPNPNLSMNTSQLQALLQNSMMGMHRPNQPVAPQNPAMNQITTPSPIPNPSMPTSVPQNSMPGMNGISANMQARQAGYQAGIQAALQMMMQDGNVNPGVMAGMQSGMGGMQGRMASAMPDVMQGRLPTGSLQDNLSGALPTRMPEGIPASMQGRMPEGIPASMQGRMPEGIPASMQGRMPEGIPASMQGRMPEGISASMQGRMPEGISASMQGRMPEGIPASMQGRMGGSMQDSIPASMQSRMPSGIPDGMGGNMQGGFGGMQNPQMMMNPLLQSLMMNSLLQQMMYSGMNPNAGLAQIVQNMRSMQARQQQGMMYNQMQQPSQPVRGLKKEHEDEAADTLARLTDLDDEGRSKRPGEDLRDSKRKKRRK